MATDLLISSRLKCLDTIAIFDTLIAILVPQRYLLDTRCFTANVSNNKNIL